MLVFVPLAMGNNLGYNLEASLRHLYKCENLFNLLRYNFSKSFVAPTITDDILHGHNIDQY